MKLIQIIITSILFTFWISCSESHDYPSPWNEITGEYSIPELNATYKVPFEIEKWSIANPQNLPSGVKFIGVDNSSELITMIVQSDDSLTLMQSINNDNIKTLIFNIIKPNPPAKISDFCPIINKKGDKWMFSTTYSLIESADTVNMANTGYYFKSNSNLIGILLVARHTILDSIDSDNLRQYFEGFNMETN